MATNPTVNWKIIIPILIIGFILRAIIAPLNHNGDMAVHIDWSRTLYHINLTNSYFYPIWASTPPTQPPIMMSLFWLSQHLYQNRYILAEFHNFSHFPPSAFITWFAQNGEVILIKLWAIVGDLSSGLTIYFLVYAITHRQKVALIALATVIFNPLTIYESAFWGQNDVAAAVFIYLALFAMVSPDVDILTLPLLFIGILVKPTIIITLPLFLFFYLKKIKLKSTVHHALGLIIGLSLAYLSFLPFIYHTEPSLPQIETIVIHRIMPSSKGIIRASNSAFNFYALFYQLDRTPGDQPFFFTNLNTLGWVITSIIFILVLIKLYLSQNSLTLMTFSIFIFCQGYFLFSTGMLERYFFPGFLAAVILYNTTKNKLLQTLLIVQNGLWFLNLLYSRPDSQLMVKTLSLISIIIYTYFLLYFLKATEPASSSATKKVLSHQAD